MEGLVNYVTRMVKCPECRAEHRIPYQGVQQFPTNVTLQRFLELHIEITGELPDPTSGQMMERCAVCSEKNYCSTCSHCDKKVCNDCKEGHLDIVKREIARVNNQVRRTLPRLQDALSTLDKNAQQLTHNCTNVIEEVESIYLRLSTALKSRMDGIKSDVENFMNKEMRSITALRANVEQEITNFQSNAEFADKHMSSSEVSIATTSVEWDDNELMDTKDIFLRTMEFIRNFETEQGDYHRRVRFFMPQDPNQLTTTLSNLGELTILPGPNSNGNTSNSLSVPSTPNLSAGLMRSKSDHRVAAQFRAAEERYGMEDDSIGSARSHQRYFGERHNTSTRLGSYGSDRRTSDFDYDDTPADTGRRSRFRSRFMRHHDSGDSDNEPANRSVRFQTDGPEGAPKKERAKVLDTEDAARGPLSGITRLADSPRVIKRLAELDTKGRRKKPTPPSILHIPTPATVTHQPPTSPRTTGRPTAASRQVSEEDEIAKIKKQNKNQEAAATGAAAATPTDQRKTEASVPSTPTSGDRPRYSVDLSSQSSRSPAPSRQTSTTDSKKNEAESVSAPPVVDTAEEARSRRRSGYLGGSSDNSASSNAPETNGRGAGSRTESRTGSPAEGSTAGSTGSGERSSRRVGRVSTDRFQKSSSESSTSAESSTHSSPVRNTGAAFSASELKSRFQSGSTGRRSSTGSQNGDSASATMATTTTRSRFGNASASTSTPSSTTATATATTTTSRFGTAGTSSAASSASATSTTNGTAPHRFQSRFLGRAGTPTAEASRGSENNDSESSSSEESDSSESDAADARTKPTSSSVTSSAGQKDSTSTRTDIGPLLARSAQARDNSNSLTSPSSNAAGSSYTRTRGSGAGLGSSALPASSATTSTGRQYGSSATSRFLGPSDSGAGSTGLTRSRTGSSLATDLENKYPLTSKYLNRSRANLDEYGSGSSSRSTGRYGGYQSRFLNKSKSSAALTLDADPDGVDGDEPSADDETFGTNQQVPLDSTLSGGGVSGDERYPSGRSRYAALKDRRSRLARSKSSHEVAQSEDGPNIQHPSVEAVDTGASYSFSSGPTGGSAEPPSPGAESSGSSLSTWARYLKNKYGPRNKDGDGETGASSGSGGQSSASGAIRQQLQQSRFSRSRSIGSTANVAGRSAEGGEQHVADVTSPGLITSPSHHQYMQKRKMLLKFGTRGSEAGAFTWPRGVAVGPENTIVVADSSNHRVQVFDSSGHFIKEFGYYGNGEGEFDCLAGVAINRIGQYIIADRYNHRIQVFDPSGRFLRVFGSQGSADGKFSYPWGVTTDALGFIYVCDKENHRVQVFQSDGTFVGKFGSMGNRPGQLEHPHYIAVSSTNRVIVSDSNNHRIQVFDVNGKVITTFGHEGADEGQFKFPRGVAVDDQGYIVVADSGNNRIQVFTADGVFVKAFGCWGSGDGEFKGLEGIAVLPNGNVVCADRENHRIQVF